MIRRLKKVDEDLYRGSAPSVDDLSKLQSELGIKRIVSLDIHAAKSIHNACKLLGIEHVVIPINVHQPASVLQLLQHDIRQLLKTVPTYFHCIQGKDRTGLLCALYRCLYQGWTCEKAILEAKLLGFGTYLPDNTHKLFLNLIKKVCGHNHKHYDEDAANDIVGEAREPNFSTSDYSFDGPDYPSLCMFESPGRFEWPATSQYKVYDDQYDTRNNRELIDWINEIYEASQMPQVGQYDFDSGMVGVGPVSIQGFI